MTDPRLIRLAAPDNVLFLATSIPAGTALTVEGEEIVLEADLTLGHKLAARAIPKGETIRKYDFPIGVATRDIPLGAHVHLQNVRSDYTPTHVIEEA